jgi:hypothetical protein
VKPFWRHNSRAIVLFLAGIGFLCALAGCQSLPRSGFDPYGERLFEARPIANCPLFNKRADSSPTTVTSTPVTIPFQQQDGASIYTPPPTDLPGSLGASTSPIVPQYGSTATALPPGAHAVTTAMIHNPEADPSPVFAEPGGYALPTVPVSGPALIMTPREQIAPLGSEVVLIASRLGNKDRLVTNEKIEWSLEGVGTIDKFDPGSHCDVLFFDYVHAKKVTDRYAITKTSQKYQTLDRGSPGTTDNVNILRGQTWITVNSMKEGTTHVNVFAPNMADWSKRTDVGIVHWVDAQWVLPRLSIAPVGESRVLTTTVLRATNGQPRHGWIVRYEILNGPAAGLGGSGAQVEEVATDVSGQATTILTPRDQRSGTNTIGIKIIRPAGQDGDRRITVGSEMVRQTWSGNPNILLNIRGPNEARLGQELLYEITAENRSSSVVQGVVALPIPPLASYIRSEPAGILQDSTVLWNVDLLPNSVAKIHAVLRQGTPGSLWLRPEFRRTGSLVVAATPTPIPVPPQNPVMISPSQPSQEATVFPGTTPSQPPISPSLLPQEPSAPAATTFQPKPSLAIEIASNPLVPVQQGEPFRFLVHITNTGTTEVKNIVAYIPFPTEISRTSVMGISTPLTMDGKPLSPTEDNRALTFHPDIHQAVFVIPSLQVGETAHAELQYPTIGSQGYTITCTVFADNQQVTQATQRIAP